MPHTQGDEFFCNLTLLHSLTSGQTDRQTDLIVALGNFVQARLGRLIKEWVRGWSPIRVSVQNVVVH